MVPTALVRAPDEHLRPVIVRWAGSSKAGGETERHAQRYSTETPVRAILRSKRYPHRRESRQIGLVKTRREEKGSESEFLSSRKQYQSYCIVCIAHPDRIMRARRNATE